MARANLLNTTDITLKGLLGNGARYGVPTYQRDYSWREDHWEDLWLDLKEVSQREDMQHYMGAIVLQQRDREEFEREKRERPWWYENGHHICGLVDGHGH